MSESLLAKFYSDRISIVAFYDLKKYDRNMYILYKDLKELLHKKFNGKLINFSHNERIIFLHDDLDFFLSDNTPGFTLYNLQLILRELNIPNYFCTVISNIPNFEKYTSLVQTMLTNDDININPISSLYFCICGVYQIGSVDTYF